jgi:hypothetical protein
MLLDGVLIGGALDKSPGSRTLGSPAEKILKWKNQIG